MIRKDEKDIKMIMLVALAIMFTVFFKKCSNTPTQKAMIAKTAMVESLKVR